MLKTFAGAFPKKHINHIETLSIQFPRVLRFKLIQIAYSMIARNGRVGTCRSSSLAQKENSAWQKSVSRLFGSYSYTQCAANSHQSKLLHIVIHWSRRYVKPSTCEYQTLSSPRYCIDCQRFSSRKHRCLASGSVWDMCAAACWFLRALVGRTEGEIVRLKAKALHSRYL